jgi:xanthine dehydrogenase YagR molybdenum-binding subunit
MSIIGSPINRVDGPLKVTGQATYAYEQWEAGQPLYGFIVGATIGKGQITGIETARAEQASGVQLVLTHQNAPEQGVETEPVPLEYWRAEPTLSGPEIHHYGEPVALVVATTFEQARAAAKLVEVAYAREDGHFDFAASLDQAYAPKSLIFGLPTDTAVGDIDAGLASAEVKIDRVYTTPYDFALPLEANNCLAVPRGEDLVVYVSTQIVSAARATIASTLKMDPERVQVICPYIGGAFGSKLHVHYETILAAFAARVLQQPVKVTLTRQQVFQLVGVRPTSHQRIRLGASPDGRLVALAQEVTFHTNASREFVEPTALGTRSLYAAPNRLTRHRLVALDVPRGEDVRAPGEATGVLTIELAMDELAEELRIDPVELRVRNEPSVDPELGHPFSDRRLMQCLRQGAEQFGWHRRPERPASLRDGQWLIGYGVASAIRAHPQAPAKARVRLEPDGSAVVQTDMTDIGTGTYTILTQVAAEELSLPVERVRVELGNSLYPATFGSGGSWGAASTSVAVRRACAAVQQKLGVSGKRVPREGLEAEGEVVGMWQEPNYAAYTINSYGAYFAEVGVDVDTAEIRLRRMLGVFSVGRVLNAKTATSQLIGGMIWGVSMALHEGAVIDTRSGGFINCDLANYLMPVHADIPRLDAEFVEGVDDKANELGARGLGELGICGSGAAVANAVYNASGVRIREFPISLETVLPGLPQLEDAAGSRNRSVGLNS